VAFDFLRLDGEGLRLRPFEARREALMRLVAGVDDILFSETLAAEGVVVFAKACELGLEGIVSKREGSFYRSGKSRNWLKTKNPDFVATRRLAHPVRHSRADARHRLRAVRPARTLQRGEAQQDVGTVAG